MTRRDALNGKVIFNGGTSEEIISYWGPTPRAWAIRWLYENIRRSSEINLSELNDVDGGTPLDGQVLVYDGTDGEWGYGTPEYGDANVQSDWNETAPGSDAFILNKPTLFSGDYNDLTNAPVSFDGDYYSLTNLPTIFEGDYNDLTNAPNLFDGDYNSLTNTPTIPQAIDDLTDVDTSTSAPSDGQILVWRSGTNQWEPANASSTSVTSIDDIGDVDITGATDGDVLSWDAATNEWVNIAINVTGAEIINDLNDVDTATVAPTDGQVLTWNNSDSEWQPATVATGSVTSIDDIGDVTSTGETAGDVLSWNPTTNNWENAQISLAIDDLTDVDTTTAAPTDGQVLTWSNADSEWQPATVAVGSVTSIGDIGDVDTSNEQDGDTIVWNSTTNTFENGPLSIDQLSDVDTSTSAPQDGQVLTWNNTNSEWEPQSAGGTGEVNVQSDWTESNTGSDAFILNKPTLFDGAYSSLTGAPTLFDGDYNSLTNQPSLFDGDYNSLSNQPSLFDGAYSSLTGAPTLFDGDYNSLTNTPTIPTSINNLTDVDTATTAPTDGQSLVWNNANSEWEPGTVTASVTSINDIGDVTITAPVNGDDILSYNGTEWVNVANPAPEVINDLNDVDTATFAPADGDILTWVAVANAWGPLANDTIYTGNGTIDETRIVSIDDGALVFNAYDGTVGAHTERSQIVMEGGSLEISKNNTSDNGTSIDESVLMAFENEGIIIAGGTGCYGISYSIDYSDNYTKRSLVDREYVDRINGVRVEGNTTIVANRFVTLTGSAGSDYIEVSLASTSATLSDLFGFNKQAITVNAPSAISTQRGTVVMGTIAGSPAIGSDVYLSNTVAGQMTTVSSSGVKVGLITGSEGGDFLVLLSL